MKKYRHKKLRKKGLNTKIKSDMVECNHIPACCIIGERVGVCLTRNCIHLNVYEPFAFGTCVAHEEILPKSCPFRSDKKWRVPIPRLLLSLL